MKEIYYLTGISGHLGRNIANSLLASGKHVIGFVLKEDDRLFLDRFPKQGTLEIRYGNVLNKEDIKNFLKCENDNSKKYLIHCAGIVSIDDKFSQKMYDINVVGTRNITDVAIEEKVDRYLYISSVHAIPEGKKGTPIKEIKDFHKDKVIGAYSKTKAEATQYVLETTKGKISTSVVHPVGLFGPEDYALGNVNQMILQFINGDLRAMVKGGYDMADARDVALGAISALEKGRDGECYILNNRYVDILDMTNILSDITGVKRIWAKFPIWAVRIFTPVIELYFKLRHEKPLFTSFALHTVLSNSNFSSEKARAELGYTTRPLEESLRDSVFWLRQAYSKK